MKRLFWLLLVVNILMLVANIVLFDRGQTPALLPEPIKGNISLVDEPVREPSSSDQSNPEHPKGGAVETATPTKTTKPTASNAYKTL